MTQTHGAAGGATPPHRLLICPPLGDDELNALFTASWPGHRRTGFQRQLRHSLLWIAAVRDGELRGYVKVVGDGGVHAFLLDPTVHPAERRRGLGAELVRRAADEARRRGAEWLHVDFEPHLSRFYARCGFRPTSAGLLRLDGAD
ncbi:GNAT family N-acetyltransferase [Streptomyces ovatisporus]|uniref:GNAT family N-acetyltransferase n=1 Tax=Streptomyces ovatisporus TaxID=1128682 RepID=A0ABV9A361_9ACTN